MNLIKPLLVLLFCLGSFALSAQTYNSKVSSDSVAVLKSRVEVLKSAIKLNELKLSEAEQEAAIEKQKLKTLDLSSAKKAATEESNRLSEALKEGTKSDMKKAEKMSKKATATARNLENALEKLQKQIDRVEETRADIQTEERKLANRKPQIIYSENRN